MSVVAEPRANPQQRIRKNTHYEAEMAKRWSVLPPGSFLPLSDGRHYQLLFVGYHGGSAGPDIRDAVLTHPNGSRLVGDIEFHTRSSDWLAHQHHTDPRYNQVILHVVQQCDDLQPTRRQDEVCVPVCSLNDLILYSDDSDEPFIADALSLRSDCLSEARMEFVGRLNSLPQVQEWPCQHVIATLSQEACKKLLVRAGILRFEQKSVAFVTRIRTHFQQETALSLEQCSMQCLIAAIAEGLGYGRDREFFRAAGLYALHLKTTIPEPLGRSPAPSHIDNERLRFLQRLVLAWWDSPVHTTGWRQIQSLILRKDLSGLRLLFGTLGLGRARTDILLCNVVLPFAVAVALVEQHTLLVECATELYLSHPGLSSNRITRMMTQQIGLRQEPMGSCQQQGLQHIYQETCQEKLCHLCMVGRNIL